MGEKIGKIKNLLMKDKKIFVLFVLAVIAIAFLAISEFAENDKNKTDGEVSVSTEEYAERIEEKLTYLISSVEGAGETVVMVTLDAGEENVYAKEIKTDEEVNGDKESNNYEYEYIVIKNGSSSESGLLLKVIEPDIRGVAVVCDGGDNASVRENIINTVSAVLDIKTNKISVCKRQADGRN